MIMMLTEFDVTTISGCLNKNDSNDDARVYFLSSKGQVVYIGQTLNFDQRIKTHEGEKDFDHISYVKVPAWRKDCIEAFYIHKLSPRLNKVLPIKGIYKSARKLIDSYDSIAKKIIRKVVSKHSRYSSQSFSDNRRKKYYMSTVEERKIIKELDSFFDMKVSSFIELGE